MPATEAISPNVSRAPTIFLNASSPGGPVVCGWPPGLARTPAAQSAVLASSMMPPRLFKIRSQAASSPATCDVLVPHVGGPLSVAADTDDGTEVGRSDDLDDVARLRCFDNQAAA